MYDDPGHINPEIAQMVRLCSDKAADQYEQYGDSRRGGEKILDRQPQELRRITQGGFSGIGLPVRVGDKTDGRIKCQIPGNIRKMLGIPAQVRLCDLQQEYSEQADDRNRKNGCRILFPRHFFLAADMQQFIEQYETDPIEPKALNISGLTASEIIEVLQKVYL